MGIRIALLGAYGAGKTTLATAAAAALGIPAVQADGPMRLDPADPGENVHDWTPAQLFGLTVERYAARRAAERHDSFVSDGGVLHEFVYGALRLRYGSYPGTRRRADRAQVPADDLTRTLSLFWAPYPHVERYLDATYTLLVHLPTRWPQPDEDPPIDELFRAHTDAMITEIGARSRLPVHVLTGDTVDERLDQLTGIVGSTHPKGVLT
ncbi:AAA family ATPase [Nocardia puris]|uniref:AAA domain-containing protein n=1 Tax=Nocardia puris TaxID=208602 RepID=A0A366E348_9NOCA|nr:AAA family ATPase [Nocardia puris]RBO96535.1 AAA domain-containing protein [Nocardia puris]